MNTDNTTYEPVVLYSCNLHITEVKVCLNLPSTHKTKVSIEPISVPTGHTAFILTSGVRIYFSLIPRDSLVHAISQAESLFLVGKTINYTIILGSQPVCGTRLYAIFKLFTT